MTCFVKDCKAVRRLLSHNTGISFHRFPNNEEDFTKWLTAINRQHENRTWKNTMYICSRHFQSQDFYTIGNKRFLKKDAYPTLNVPESGTKIVPKTIKDSVTGISKETMKESTSESSKTFEELNLLTAASISEIPTEEKRLYILTYTTCASNKTASLGEPSGSDSRGSRKRRHFKLKHNYMIRPSTINKTIMELRKKYIKLSSRLYRARQSITKLNRRVNSLKTLLQDLKSKQVMQ